MAQWYECMALLLVVRSFSAMYSPIMDCDETFNYWEPLHYLFYGRGFQTWEYSPEFALRTYAYLGLHGMLGLPLHFLNGSLEVDKVQLFYFIRACLGMVSALGESLFCVSVGKKFGGITGPVTLLFLCTNSGMFHSSVALIPSSTCMLAVLFGFSTWLDGKHILGLVFGSFGALLCWPFMVLMFVPMGFHALYERGFVRVVTCALGCMVAFIGLPAAIDTHIYGKPTIALFNLIQYNVFDSQGASLYGTEPWHFYLKNLALNFNIILPLALVAPLLTIVFGTGARSKDSPGTISRLMALLYLSPMVIALVFFSAMEHKEERFLTMIYPLLCMAAAVSVNTFLDVSNATFLPRFASAAKLVNAVVVLVLLLSSTMSVSRSVGLHVNFGAPLKVWAELNTALAGNDTPATVCVAKEWYRFPTTFFLPQNVTPLWLRSSFTGHLPQHFTPVGAFPWPGAQLVHSHFNDRNEEDASAYSQLEQCDFAVDLSVGDDNGDIGAWADAWSKVHCVRFLDSGASPAFVRSFYIPFGVSERSNVYAEYCLLKRVKGGDILPVSP
jgi:alpha-1,2-mannosyltransferase